MNDFDMISQLFFFSVLFMALILLIGVFKVFIIDPIREKKKGENEWVI